MGNVGSIQSYVFLQQEKTETRKRATPRGRKVHFEPLEPRILLSADRAPDSDGFAAITFAGPEASLIIEAGDAADTIILDPLAPGSNASVAIEGGAGTHRLVASAADCIELSPGTLMVEDTHLLDSVAPGADRAGGLVHQFLRRWARCPGTAGRAGGAGDDHRCTHFARCDFPRGRQALVRCPG